MGLGPTRQWLGDIGMARRYNLTLIRNLSRQLRLSPKTQRELQISRLEHLIRDLQPGRRYPENYVVYRLTLYNPPPSRKSVEGGELKADLINLLDGLSATLDIRATRKTAANVLTLDQIRDLYDISAKTLEEWRRSGLITRRYIFPDGVQRSAATRAHVETFVASIGQGPMYQIRVPNAKQRGLILGEAAALAKAGNVSLPEAVRRLAAKLDLPPRLVRHAIRTHEMADPDHLLFPSSVVPLDEAKRRKMLAAHQAGQEQREIARVLGLSRRLVASYLKKVRAEELLRHDVEYRYDPVFDGPDADDVVLNDPALDPPPAKPPREPPEGMPPYFADLSRLPLLAPGEEHALFRKYNYIKFTFARLRESLKPSEGDDPRLLARLETLADEASRCRARLVEANLRLVVKLARQHAGRIMAIDPLISEGNLSLLNAVEKFDFTRGTRFSTYATWCVVKRFARVVPEENYVIGTYRTGAEEVIEIQPDRSTSELEQKENLDHIRMQLSKVMEHLGDRERQILSLRFGLVGSPQTLEQVGAVLGITRERVRQLEMRALRKAADVLHLQVS